MRDHACNTAVNVTLVGGSPQFPVTPGLVQVNALPPTVPETVNVPVHPPVVAVAVAVKVNAPEKDVGVMVPPTVPLFGTVPFVVIHVPLTVAPFCVSVSVMA
jgi:hypothetical protein